MTVGKLLKLSLIGDKAGLSNSICLEITGGWTQPPINFIVPATIEASGGFFKLLSTPCNLKSKNYMTIEKLLKISFIWDVAGLFSSICLEVKIKLIKVKIVQIRFHEFSLKLKTASCKWKIISRAFQWSYPFWCFVTPMSKYEPKHLVLYFFPR